MGLVIGLFKKKMKEVDYGNGYGGGMVREEGIENGRTSASWSWVGVFILFFFVIGWEVSGEQTLINLR